MTSGAWYCTHMTNNTAHATCSHPRTKVDRARCRKTRAVAASRKASDTYYVTLQANGSKVTHHAIYNDAENAIPACTRKAVKGVPTLEQFDTAPTVTCQNCTKNVTPIAYPF